MRTGSTSTCPDAAEAAADGAILDQGVEIARP
jgi:hypothetical protein